MQNIKKKVVNLFKIIFRLLIDLDIIAFLRFLSRNKVIFLFYHGVSVNPDLELNSYDGKHVALYKFEQEMAYIKKKYNVVPVDEAIAMLRHDVKMVPNTVAVTFDDGYYNNFSYALPILKKFNIPATIFLTIDYIEKGKSGGFLSWKEISDMHKQGIKFGAHTVTHPVLTHIPIDQVEFELRDSRNRLGSYIKDSVLSFAYPYGIFNQRIADMVRDVGYSYAFTTFYGVNTHARDPYKLKRIGINNNFSFEYFVVSLFPFLRNIANSIYGWRQL